MLSDKQLAKYREDGFLVVPQYLSRQDVDNLRKAAGQIIEQADLQHSSVFSSDDKQGDSDAYFLESGDKIRCFYEKEAVDKGDMPVTEKQLAINKIGHALHDRNETFQTVTYRSRLKEIAQQLGLEKPSVVQSQYIFKQPGIGGDVKPHQDAAFLFTEPSSCTGFWIALEKADTENGCLYAMPKSHRNYPLTKRFIRMGAPTSTGFVAISDDTMPQKWDAEQMVPIEVEAGDLVLLHGLCVHMSHANRSQRSRHAYVMHAVDMNAPWPNDNWLQRPSNFPFRLL